MTPTILAAILLTADGGATSHARSAEDVSIDWLIALAHHDSATLKALSGFPLAVDGFQSNDKPQTNPCEGVPGMSRNPKTREVRVSANTESQFDKMIACVFADNAGQEWTERLGVQGAFKGRVRLLSRAAQSSQRLARYRKEVARLPQPRVLVEAVTKDDGVTLSALLVLRASSESFVVEAVHTDFLFEE